MSPSFLSIVRTNVEEGTIKKHDGTKDFLRSIAKSRLNTLRAFIMCREIFFHFSKYIFQSYSHLCFFRSNEGGLASSYFQLCLYDRLNPNFRRKAIRLDGLVWSAEVFHCVAVMTRNARSSLWQMRGETFSLNGKFTIIDLYSR